MHLQKAEPLLWGPKELFFILGTNELLVVLLLLITFHHQNDNKGIINIINLMSIK